jgi:hypothetical protein
MNERGEITFLGTLLMLCLSSLVLLSALELERSFKRLKQRSTLILCTKEAKGELRNLLTTMGQTNWGIKNLERVKLLAMLFPGMGMASKSAEDIKTGLKLFQDVKMLSFLKTIATLRVKGCPMDPRFLQTPFEMTGTRLKRNQDGTIKIRSTEWNHHFVLRPYQIQLKIKLVNWEAPSPRLQFLVEDRPEKLLSLLQAF